jgi:hypothetical protein
VYRTPWLAVHRREPRIESERVYAALVRLYPRAFRQHYGADLAQLLRDQCAEEPAWRVYGRALVDCGAGGNRTVLPSTPLSLLRGLRSWSEPTSWVTVGDWSYRK